MHQSPQAQMSEDLSIVEFPISTPPSKMPAHIFTGLVNAPGTYYRNNNSRSMVIRELLMETTFYEPNSRLHRLNLEKWTTVKTTTRRTGRVMDARTGKMIVYDRDDYELLNRLNALLRLGKLTHALNTENSKLRRSRQAQYKSELETSEWAEAREQEILEQRRNRQADFDAKMAALLLSDEDIPEDITTQGLSDYLTVGMPSVDKATGKFEALADNIAKRAEQIAEESNRTANSIASRMEDLVHDTRRQINSGIDTATERLTAAMSSIQKSGVPFWVKAAKVAFVMAQAPLRNGTTTQWVLWLGLVLVSCDLTLASVFRSLMNSFGLGELTSYTDSEMVRRFGAQVGTFEEPIIGGATATVADAFNKFLFDGSIAFEKLEKVIKRFGNLSRGISSISSLTEKIWSWLFPAMFKLAWGVDYETYKLSNVMKGLLEWRAKVSAYLSVKDKEKLKTDVTACDDIEALYKQGYAFLNRATELKIPPKEMQVLNAFMRLTQGLYDEVTRSGASKRGARMEPVVILLRGESGVGKTTLVFDLAVRLVAVAGIPMDVDNIPDPMSQIYARNVEQEFWCGYNGQLVCYYDDFGQLVDSTSVPNPEFLELIRTGHIGEYPLHMADIESKDKTYFKSEVILATTNLKRLAPTSITCPDAVRRRITHSLVVKVKPEFCLNNTPRVDPKKVCCRTETGAPGPFCPHIYEFIEKDEYLEKETGNKYNYDELVELLTNSYAHNRNKSDGMKNHLKNLAQELQRKKQVVNIDDSLPAAQVGESDFAYTQKYKSTSNEEWQQQPIFDREREEEMEMTTPAEVSYLLEGLVEPMDPLNSTMNPSWDDLTSDRAEMLDKILTLNCSQILKGIPPMEDLDHGVAVTEEDESVIRARNEEACKFRHNLIGEEESVCGCEVEYDSPHHSLWHNYFKTHQQGKFYREYLLASSEEERDAIRSAQPLVGSFALFRNFWRRLIRCKEFAIGVGKEKYNNMMKMVDHPKQFAYITMMVGLLPFVHIIKMIKNKEVFRGVCKNRLCFLIYNKFMFSQMMDGLISRAPKPVRNLIEAVDEVAHKYIYPVVPPVAVKILASLGSFYVLMKMFKWAWKLYRGADAPAVEHKNWQEPVKMSEEMVTEQYYDNQPRPNQIRVQQYYDANGKPVAHRVEQYYDEQGRPYVMRVEQQYDTTNQKAPVLRTENKTKKKIQIYAPQINVPTMEEGLECSRLEPEDVPSPQMARDPCAKQVSTKIIKNTYYMECCQMTDGHVTGVRGILRGFFIRGRIMLTARHFRPYVEKADMLHIANGFNPEGFNIPTKYLKMYDVDDASGELKDQMLIEFPRTIQDHGDIMEHLATSEEISKFTKVRGCLVVPGDYVYVHHSDIEAHDLPIKYDDPVMKQSFMLRKSYTYAMETQGGDCGSPLIALNAHIKRKIIGLHVAGGGTGWKGYATPINAEDIRRALKKASTEAQIQFQLDGLVKELRNDVPCPPGNFVPVGVPQFFSRGPAKTSFVPSSLQGIWLEPTTRPAALLPVKVDGVLVDPLQQGLEKAGRNPVPLNQDYLKAAKRSVDRLFPNDPARQRVYTIEEASCGVEGDEFAVGVPRTTSAGYPYKHFTTKPGKKDFLGETKDDPFIAPGLRRDVEHRIDMARNNQRYPTIWIDTKKDERRPLEKVRLGKTRIFSAGPVDFTLAMRMYFLGFAAHVMDKRIDNEIAVGTNVYSTDWARIAENMQKMGPRVIAGDFSNYDGTLNPDLLGAVLDVINTWYNGTEEETRIRTVLWKEITNSVHVFDGTVYLWNHSQPSGNPLTAILNSVYNILSLRYVWMDITVGTPFHTMSEYERNVTAITYGDDNVLNVSEAAAPFYNQIAMAESYAKFGMTYTDELKTGEMVAFRTLSDVQFLKRAFSYDQALCRWRAPLTLATVLEMPNWVRKTPDLNTDQQTCLNIEAAVFELALHGEQVFVHYTEMLATACRIANLRPSVGTYYEYVSRELATYGGMDLGPKGMSGTDFISLVEAATESPEDAGHFGSLLAKKQQIKASCAGVTLSAQVNNSVASNEQVETISAEQAVARETQQITSFVDDVAPTMAGKPAIVSALDVFRSAHEGRDHTVKDVLSRPVTVWTGTLDNALTPAFSLKFPDVLLDVLKNNYAKVSYFTYLRANIAVRLVVNSHPFQLGRYYMAFSPFDSYSNRPMGPYLPQLTGYPGVEVDLSAHQTIELRIPYCSPLSHYNLVQGTSTMGELKLMPIVPLESSVSADTCGATLFAWFEDIELSMPTSAKPKNLTAQVGSDSKEKGLISSSFKTLSRASTFRPVRWLLGAAGGIAESEGFTKPSDETQPKPIVNTPGRGFTHCDNEDQGVKLAATASNSLPVPRDLFSSGQDEMDVSFVARKKCILFPLQATSVTTLSDWTTGAINWQPADAVGKVLMRIPVTPAFMSVPASTASYYPTLVAYLSVLFEMWSGSLEYRVSVVKTAFHTGRLRISFHPGCRNSDVDATNSENCHNIVLDLAENSDETFRVDYTNSTSWLYTRPQVNIGGAASADWIPNNNIMGYLVIQVVTPLRIASQMAAQGAAVVVSMGGGPDLSFARPTKPRAYPTAQVHGEVQEVGSTGEGNAKPLFSSRWVKGLGEELTVGESITNLRQVTRRFTELTSIRPTSFWLNRDDPEDEKTFVNQLRTVPNGFTDTNAVPRFLELDTAYFGNKLNGLSSAITAMGKDSTDRDTLFNVGVTLEPNYLHLISQIYRFYTGSRRYKVFLGSNPELALDVNWVNTTPGSTNQITAFPTPSSSNARAPNPVMVYTFQNTTALKPLKPFMGSLPQAPIVGTFEHALYPDVNGVVEFEVPWYGITPFGVVTEEDTSDTSFGPINERLGVHLVQGVTPTMATNIALVPSGALGFAANFVTPAMSNLAVYTAGGDDFTFGYLIGAPPLQFKVASFNDAPAAPTS